MLEHLRRFAPHVVLAWMTCMLGTTLGVLATIVCLALGVLMLWAEDQREKFAAPDRAPENANG